MPAIGSFGLFSRQNQSTNDDMQIIMENKENKKHRDHSPGTGYMRIQGSLPPKSTRYNALPQVPSTGPCVLMMASQRQASVIHWLFLHTALCFGWLRWGCCVEPWCLTKCLRNERAERTRVK
ncbi:hypothetical protein TRIATDRAFT_300821 [Trichoderma atroviride IMI 206040]|uniref:Uncharacterized protein n=1 Tax=Hypocrea atroviridis (strain ATCC 20476 / IMI 206040) TaxID=452589 RepID=G9P2Z1_HYPAI|nr:uncharacterized protein TRIATDRAFT_300821 [Trichoderma atroviride IMI 206040]EHK42765.1 hypothetical protein TRIATDRAFT_300821 [Trichoderma atroviride IMI 206040]